MFAITYHLYFKYNQLDMASLIFEWIMSVALIDIKFYIQKYTQCITHRRTVSSTVSSFHNLHYYLNIKHVSIIYQISRHSTWFLKYNTIDFYTKPYSIRTTPCSVRMKVRGYTQESFLNLKKDVEWACLLKMQYHVEQRLLTR